MACAGKYQLVTASKTRLQMWQHRADHDPQTGSCHWPKYAYWNSLRCLAQVFVGGDVVNRRAQTAVAGCNFLTNTLLALIACQQVRGGQLPR